MHLLCFLPILRKRPREEAIFGKLRQQVKPTFTVAILR
jgi:hypothetical protein